MNHSDSCEFGGFVTQENRDDLPLIERLASICISLSFI
jgi:hypothetical protein